MAIPQIQNWQGLLLEKLGKPDTPANRQFLDAWQRSEGGTAANNPFNTTQRAPGSTAYNTNNGFPVQSYTNPQQGIQATVDTLNNGRYANILNALQQGNSALNAAYALRDSPWGTGALTVKVLGGDPNAGAKIQQTAQIIQDSQNKTGSLDAALQQLLQPTTQGTPAGNQFLQGTSIPQLLDFARPSATGVNALSKLGGIAGGLAASNQGENLFSQPATAPPPAQTVSSLPTMSTKVPKVNVQVDHNEPIPQTAVPIINLAEKYLGTPYTWGGADPRRGFDCSGFVQWLYSQPAGGGMALGRTTYAQAKQGVRVAKEDLKPGDVVFFEPGSKGPEHEGLYIGQGQFIHSPHTGDSVKISSLNSPWYQQNYVTARRFIPDRTKAKGGAL
jgi:cell wall-associated NlpC family hydrolase